MRDQSFLTRFVKGFSGHCCYRGGGGGLEEVVAFLTAAFEDQVVTGSLLAKPHDLWPVSHRI
jgi:hypothetical protein